MRDTTRKNKTFIDWEIWELRNQNQNPLGQQYPQSYVSAPFSWTRPIQGSDSPGALSSCLSRGCCDPVWCSLVRGVTAFVLAMLWQMKILAWILVSLMPNWTLAREQHNTQLEGEVGLPAAGSTSHFHQDPLLHILGVLPTSKIPFRKQYIKAGTLVLFAKSTCLIKPDTAL